MTFARRAAWLLVVGALGACKPKSNDSESATPVTGEDSGTDTDDGQPGEPFKTVLPGSYPAASDSSQSSGLCTPISAAARVLPERRLSDAYLDLCSGCHGVRGEGAADVPALAGNDAATLGTYRAKVRGPVTGRMPAFSEAMLSDETLAQDFALLSGEKELPSFDSRMVPLRPAKAPSKDPEYAAVMAKGVTAWRTPGERGACASCHGPDGIDLARIGYPASAILRRAMGQGLPPDLSMNVVAMIEAQRARHGIDDPCAPEAFAPLQPGNRMLEGATASARDEALVAALEPGGVDLRRSIESAADAASFVTALAQLDVGKVPLAFTLNGYAEDAFHGDDHRSTAEWLPEIPMEPKDSEAAVRWTALENAYIESPTAARLWRLLDGVGDLSGARFTDGGVSERLAKEKFRSVLLFQHLLRRGAVAMPDLTATDNPNRFFVWETAQISDVMARGCAEGGSAAVPFPCWNYPASFFKKMGTDRAHLLEDVVRITFPWLVAGWRLDPALQLTEGGDAQMLHLHNASYRHWQRFGATKAGEDRQLPVHNAYFSLVRLAKSIAAPDVSLPSGSGLASHPTAGCWTSAGPALRQWVVDTLPAVRRMLNEPDHPAKASHQELTHAVVASADRAILWMMRANGGLDQPPSGCPTGEKERTALEELVKAMRQWHRDEAVDRTEIDSLADSVLSGL